MYFPNKVYLSKFKWSGSCRMNFTKILNMIFNSFLFNDQQIIHSPIRIVVSNCQCITDHKWGRKNKKEHSPFYLVYQRITHLKEELFRINKASNETHHLNFLFNRNSPLRGLNWHPAKIIIQEET